LELGIKTVMIKLIFQVHDLINFKKIKHLKKKHNFNIRLELNINNP